MRKIPQERAPCPPLPVLRKFQTGRVGPAPHAECYSAAIKLAVSRLAFSATVFCRREFLTTPPTPLVRKARLQDLDALLQLEHSSFTTDLLSRERMRHWIKAANGILLVATSPGDPDTLLGYCLGYLRKNSRTIRMYSLVTSAAARGQGIGRLLLQSAEQQAFKAGCTRVRLEVAEHNTNAIRLYQQLDYQQFDYVPGFYEDGQNALRMEKNLKNHG